MIDVDNIHPHPQNPRKDFGDLTELAESIKVNGVLQNLTVVRGYAGDPNDLTVVQLEDGVDLFTAVIGNRRLAAARLAGLTEAPCVVAEMDEKEQIATMLLENIQRSDLTPWEQAEGFQLMMDLGETESGIAKKTGFSETTVKRRLSLFKYGKETVDAAIANRFTLMDFVKLDQIRDKKERKKTLDNGNPANIEWALQTQARQDRAKERAPGVTKILKSFAKHNPKRSWWGYDSEWPEWKEFSLTDEAAPDILVPDDTDTAKYEYVWRDAKSKAQVKILRKGPKPKTPKTKAEIEEAAAKRQFNARVKDIKAIAERAYGVRIDFARGIIGNSAVIDKHIDAVIDSAVHCMAGMVRGDSDVLKELLGAPDDDTGYIYTKDIIAHAVSNGFTSRQIFFAQVYALLDEKSLVFHDAREFGYKIKPIEDGEYRAARSDAMRVYGLLSVFGYEMATEERQYVEGTHGLYDKED
jgi:ParB family chromosome partitioning protein